MAHYMDADNDGVPDLAPEPPLRDPAPKTKISPKVVASTVAAFLIPTVIILIDYLLGEGRGIFAGWHPVLQLAIFSLLTSLGTLVAGFVKRDGLRELGARRSRDGVA